MENKSNSKVSIKVLPNAARNEILGLSGGVWRIKVAAAPDKGKANKELISFLSEVLELKRDDLCIFRGHTSHNKIISVTGLTQEEVISRFTRKK